MGLAQVERRVIVYREIDLLKTIIMHQVTLVFAVITKHIPNPLFCDRYDRLALPCSTLFHRAPHKNK